MSEQKTSTFPNMVITLTVVTLVSAFSLGFVFDWTEEPIAAARLARQMRAINQVLKTYENDPVTDAFYIPCNEINDSLLVFPGYAQNQKTGVAIRTYSNKGYTTRIWLMVGFDDKNKISNVVILDHKETPGLGSKISQSKFIDQYNGLSPRSNDLKVTKDGGEIDAISGATISSRAVSEAIQLAYDTYLNHLQYEERTDQ